VLTVMERLFEIALFVVPVRGERGNAAFRATQLGGSRPRTRTGVPRGLGTGVGARRVSAWRCPSGVCTS